MSEGDLVDAEGHHEMSKCFVARLLVLLEKQSVFLKDNGNETIEVL